MPPFNHISNKFLDLSKTLLRKKIEGGTRLCSAEICLSSVNARDNLNAQQIAVFFYHPTRRGFIFYISVGVRENILEVPVCLGLFPRLLSHPAW